MKVIDLLNKIANGEEVPKKIKYRKCIFEYKEEYKDYFTKNGIIPTTFDTNGIFRNIFLDYNNCLNDEMEIIEEDKKIEHIGANNYEWNYKYDLKTPQAVVDNLELVRQKINEIIDCLEENK